MTDNEMRLLAELESAKQRIAELVAQAHPEWLEELAAAAIILHLDLGASITRRAHNTIAKVLKERGTQCPT